MKIIILSIIISLSNLSYGFKDSLKFKKIDFLFEAGLGNNLVSSFNRDDSISFLSNSKRSKINFGLFYNISREWKLYGNIGLSKIRVSQFVRHPFSEKAAIYRHKINGLTFNGSMYHCLIHDNKSTLYMGIGYSGNYAFDKEIKSKSKSIKIEGELYDSFIKAYPSQNVVASFNIGLLYDYKFDNFDIGFKVDFSAFGSYTSKYKFEIEDHLIHEDFYSPASFFVENSIFFKF